jgi:hypothetical protein
VAKLSKTVQRFIVQQLACFESPSEVVEAVKEEYGITVTRQAVEHYDPTKGGEGKGLAKEHEELFHATRERFISKIDALAISHKAYRLNQLEQIMRNAKRRRNWGLAAQMLEQAAKETGGLYTNKREHSGPGGGAIPIDVGSKRKELAAQMLRKLMDKGQSEQDARASLITMGVDADDLPAI